MKLYTEEQVIQILYWMSPTYVGREEVEEQIKKELTPIELPSDEEINNKAFYVPFDGKEEFYDNGFINGAKWMREQILNQNNK